MNLMNIKIPIASMLCIAVLLGSCAKQISVPEQAAKVVVVNAFLETGSPIDHIHVTSLNNGDGVQGIRGLDVRISDGESESLLTESSDEAGAYLGAEDFIIQQGKTYSLEILKDGELISASTTSPPSLIHLDVSKQYLEIDQDNDLVFLEWEGLNQGSFNEYFYLVTVRPLTSQDDLQYINRSSGVFQGPRAISLSYNPEVTLNGEFFYYYGDHLVEVMAINMEYETYFRAQLDFSQNAPGNIDGGVGFFVGTSVLSTVIDIR